MGDYFSARVSTRGYKAWYIPTMTAVGAIRSVSTMYTDCGAESVIPFCKPYNGIDYSVAQSFSMVSWPRSVK